MKNRNTEFKAILVALAFALAPIVQAAPQPGGGPSGPPANEAPSPGGGPTGPPANDRANANSEASSAYSTSSEGENLPVVTIHSTGNIPRGKTGSFVLDMKPAVMFGGTYVKFSVSGTAIPGVDYVALVSPAYIGQSGYAVILVIALPDPRGSSIRQAYSVVITLDPGAGYAVGQPSSATMWITP
jgi:hypothetical protein